MKERSDGIFESTILSSLKCIPILYDILELILKLIHNRKQDQKFGTPNAVGYQIFVCAQSSLRILARILIYQKNSIIQEAILKPILNENKKIFLYDLGTKSYVKIG